MSSETSPMLAYALLTDGRQDTYLMRSARAALRKFSNVDKVHNHTVPEVEEQ